MTIVLIGAPGPLRRWRTLTCRSTADSCEFLRRPLPGGLRRCWLRRAATEDAVAGRRDHVWQL
eukprot:2433480-Prymnesium_polylepis.1